MINKNVHKYLAHRNGNYILIWIWNSPWVGNLGNSGLGKGDPLGISEVTMFGNKIGISDGEVLVIIIEVSDRSKLGGDE